MQAEMEFVIDMNLSCSIRDNMNKSKREGKIYMNDYILNLRYVIVSLFIISLVLRCAHVCGCRNRGYAIAGFCNNSCSLI